MVSVAACLRASSLSPLVAPRQLVQQVTGVPSPNEATITGKQLPPPIRDFGGLIKETASDSKA